MAQDTDRILNTVFDPVNNRLKTTPLQGATPHMSTVHDEIQGIIERVYDPVTQTLRTIQVA